MSHAPRDPQAGVTLIEMLVAVAICALIGLAGFGILDTILRVNDRTEGDLDRYADLDRTFLVLGRDLVAARAADLRLEDDVLRIETSEGGAVRYALADATLTRRLGSPEVAQRLVDGVAAAQWRVLGPDGDWRDDWLDGPPGRLSPRGIELWLDLTGARSGSVRRLFRLTPGPVP